MAKQSNTKVITGLVRLSYANVWEPKSINGGDPKYSCSIIVPKTDTETVNAMLFTLPGNVTFWSLSARLKA